MGILVLAALMFFLLNMFGMAQLGSFGCGFEPQFNVGAPAAEAASEGCPDNLKGAATDAAWAADRTDSIANERPTVLLAYDEDGFEHRFRSAADTDEERVIDTLRELGFPPDRAGNYPAASHAEAKVAYWMREGKVKHVVAVINNRKGVCVDEDQTCDAVVKALLPRGYLLEGWSPGRSKPTQLPGGA